MRRVDKKGFTLIEVIISFAVLVIIGTMFVFGFYNTVSLYSEGALIKDTTNELYEDIIKQNDKIFEDTMENKISIVVNGVNKTIDGKMKYAQSTIQYSGGIDVRLSCFWPTTEAEQLPASEDGTEEVSGLPARFFIAKKLSDIPLSLSEFNGVSGNYMPLGNTVGGTEFVNILRSDCEFNVFNANISDYFLRYPVTSLNTQLDNLDSNYRNCLDSSYRIKWFYADNYSGGVVKVYGYLIPTLGRILQITDSNNKTHTIDLDPDIYYLDNFPDFPNNGKRYFFYHSNGEPVLVNGEHLRLQPSGIRNLSNFLGYMYSEDWLIIVKYE